jgi:hypothetical protein
MYSVEDMSEGYDINTVHHLKVIEVFRGQTKLGNIVQITQLGGRIGNQELIVHPPSVELNIGDDLIRASRHVVFTIAEELRPYFAHDRSLLHLLFQAVSDTLFFALPSLTKQSGSRRGSFAFYTPLGAT